MPYSSIHAARAVLCNALDLHEALPRRVQRSSPLLRRQSSQGAEYSVTVNTNINTT